MIRLIWSYLDVVMGRMSFPTLWRKSIKECVSTTTTSVLVNGSPIGGDPRRLDFWEPMLARLKNRLYGWKSRFLSYDVRLVQLKSVLISLLVYALSFFKAPS
jgi:hypothetical protein